MICPRMSLPMPLGLSMSQPFVATFDPPVEELMLRNHVFLSIYRAVQDAG